jgi:hypothetical protein
MPTVHQEYVVLYGMSVFIESHDQAQRMDIKRRQWDERDETEDEMGK